MVANRSATSFRPIVHWYSTDLRLVDDFQRNLCHRNWSQVVFNVTSTSTAIGDQSCSANQLQPYYLLPATSKDYLPVPGYHLVAGDQKQIVSLV